MIEHLRRCWRTVGEFLINNTSEIIVQRYKKCSQTSLELTRELLAGEYAPLTFLQLFRVISSRRAKETKYHDCNTRATVTHEFHFANDEIEDTCFSRNFVVFIGLFPFLLLVDMESRTRYRVVASSLRYK